MWGADFPTLSSSPDTSWVAYGFSPVRTVHLESVPDPTSSGPSPTRQPPLQRPMACPGCHWRLEGKEREAEGAQQQQWGEPTATMAVRVQLGHQGQTPRVKSGVRIHGWQLGGHLRLLGRLLCLRGRSLQALLPRVMRPHEASWGCCRDRGEATGLSRSDLKNSGRALV